MRVLPSVTGAALAVAATVLFSPAAFADAPGDNGTVKIHDATTGEELLKNEPHVCTFYLDAFYFDGRQQAAWEIDQQAPTGKAKVADGAITLDAKGHGRTADMTLPDGHYKLVWNFDGEHGKAKHKVFWVDCPAGTPTTSAPGSTSSGGDTSGSTSGGDTSGSTSGGDTSGSTAGGTTTGSTTTGGSTATTGTSGGTAAPSASPSASPGSNGGSLASTGASVGGIALLAAVLVGAGALVRFRRKGAARQH